MWTSSNPVVIGEPTKKSDYDKLWDNADYIYNYLLKAGPFFNAREFVSINAAVAAIGSTEATLVVSEQETLTASLTIPSTLSLLVLKGGSIVTTSYVLTVYGKIEAGFYQIFSGTGTVVYTGKKYPEWWGAIDDSGVTDNLAAINYALGAGGESELSAPNGGYYKITDDLNMTVAGTSLYSHKYGEIRQATSNKGGINVTASNCQIKGIKLQGPQYVASQVSEMAINAYGADASNYITDLVVENCQITTWGFYAIYLVFVSDFKITGNKITNIYMAGVQTLSAIRGKIKVNDINNIVGTPNAYGIALSREEQDSLVNYPRSSDIRVEGNLIRGVTYWEGLDTHAGSGITFIGNRVYGCKIAIMVGGCDAAGDIETYAPLDVVIDSNILDSGVTDGTLGIGIIFTGANNAGAVQQYGKGSIVGNIIRGYGTSTSAISGAIEFRDTVGLVISGNTIIQPSPNGISVYNNNLGFSITGNTIIDAWTDTVGVGESRGVYVDTVANTGIISGNSFLKESKAATYLCTYGVKINNSANVATCFVKLEKNYNLYDYLYGDVIDASRRGKIGDTSTSGTGQDNLALTQIGYSMLKIGTVIHVFAAGTKTGVSANKTLKFYVGSTGYEFNAAANDENDWRLVGEVIITGAATQRVTWTGWNGTTITQGYEAGAENLSASAYIGITGECANGGDVITQTMWIVDIF